MSRDVLLLIVTALVGLSTGAWFLSRNRRSPGFWEGGFLWVVSFLVVVTLLVKS